MNKSSFFTGQPIFSQLLHLIPRYLVKRACKQNSADRYCKKFDTYHHLVTMLYSCYQHCTSLREVVTGMRACEGRLQCLGVGHLPARSTLAEANARRPWQTFEHIYTSLYHRYKSSLPDSRTDKSAKDLVIIDATTISLFQEILKAAGGRGLNGKKKGGIKVHVAMQSSQDVPFLIRLTAAAQADVSFLQQLHLPAGSVVVMDRGYNNFKKFNEWTNNKVSWITRLRGNTVVNVTAERHVSEQQKQSGILRDQHVRLGFKNNFIQQVNCRLIHYYDKESKRVFAFLTNNFRYKPSRITDYYKRRWQIELLFKRLKQNMQLQYFLGDNENAIRIQIFCCLIADLLLKVATAGVKRKWAYSNIACLVRLHLMNYTRLNAFLQNPEKCRIYNPPPQLKQQLELNLSG